MKILFLFTLGMFYSQMLISQVAFQDSVQLKNETPSIIKQLDISQDQRLEKMVGWHIEKNKKKDGIQGYRVEIFFSSELNAKEKALKKKVEFLSKYSDYDVHILFMSPNFKVRVGDFRTKNEALKVLKKIQGNYPVAFIVPDIIDFPLLKPLHYE